MLRHMRKSHARDAVRLRTGRDPDELLRELYVERGYNYVQIGKAIGVSRELVRQWVEAAGLERPSAETAITGDAA